MKILVINGPNLNMLGEREAEHYGHLSLENIEEMLHKEFPNVDFEFFQSNLEGEIINQLQRGNYQAVIINPGGYAHTSVAIKDALEIIKKPKIEVHLSHLSNREEFRKTLVTASSCNGYISGFKEFSYAAAVYLIQKMNGDKF